MSKSFESRNAAKHFRAVAVIFLILLLGLTLIRINHQEPKTSTSVSDEAYDFLISFLDTCKNDPENAASFCHFEDDFEREAYVLSNKKLIAYEILDSDALSENLYVFKLHLTKEYQDIPERYYFVGEINDQLYLMNNVYNIPPDMLDTIDEQEMAQYTGDTLVRSSNVLK